MPLPRTSSPLNPHRSSSPTPLLSSSPTPAATNGASPWNTFDGSSRSARALPPPPPQLNYRRASSSKATPGAGPSSRPLPSSTTPRPLSTRYTRTTPASSLAARRPRPPRTNTYPSASSSAAAHHLPAPPPPPDLFGAGPTPTEGAMWRDRLQRRMADRERRKRARDGEIARRRGTDAEEEDWDEEEAERQAQADDEEIFRRLMVLQRRREEHAHLVSYEASGGSDPLLPEFWEEELEALAREERALLSRLDAMDVGDEDEDHGPRGSVDSGAEEDAEAEAAWAAAAAAAEEAEIAARVEEEMMMASQQQQHAPSDVYDMEFTPDEWAAIAAMEGGGGEDEAMDVEM